MKIEDIKIVKEQPPFLLKIVSAGMRPQFDTIFPWSPNIFNPSGLDIPPDIFIHEVVHIRQQGNNPEAWWQRYLNDSGFRFEQELEAFAGQYNFVKNASISFTLEFAATELA